MQEETSFKSFIHAVYCRDNNCLLANCAPFKYCIEHQNHCGNTDCLLCPKIIALTVCHFVYQNSEKSTVDQNNILAKTAENLSEPIKSWTPSPVTVSHPSRQDQFNQALTEGDYLPKLVGSFNQASITSTEKREILKEIRQNSPLIHEKLAEKVTETIKEPGQAVDTFNLYNSFEYNSQMDRKIPDLKQPAKSKPWHRKISDEIRKHLVHVMIRTILPAEQLANFSNAALRKLVGGVVSIELRVYEKANDYEEYYDELAERIYKVQEATKHAEGASFRWFVKVVKY